MTIITPLSHRIFVRFARKPIWMPTAPSKLFRIAEHNFYTPEEVKQIYTISRAFKAQEQSIQEFMKHEFYIPATQSGGLPAEFIEKEAELDKRLYEENERENARVAKLKEEAFNQQLRAMEDKIMEEKMNKEERFMETARKIDQYVKDQKSDPNSFVTPDNIDAIIEQALENPVNFEYCIEISGNKRTT